MASDGLRCEVADSVAWITLDKPEAMNAFDAALAAELDGALDRVAADAQVRALVITGVGQAFCAGGDVASFHANIDRAADYADAIIGSLHRAIATIDNLGVPVIAGVNGVAAGAGMGLVLTADLAIAAESAVFVMGYTGIGASPDGSSSFFLPRLLGTRRAMELTLTNRTLSAAEALDWGLVNRVVADAEFPDALAAYAARLASGPTKAFAAARRLIRASHNTSLVDQLDDERRAFVANAESDDFREGVAAFNEKRKPAFRGS